MAVNDSTLPRTRIEAQEIGAAYFFTGNPCRNGHIALRYVKSRGACVECCREQKARRLQREPELHKTSYLRRRESALAYSSEYRKKHTDRLRQQARKYANQNAERHRETARAWKQANPERAAINARKWKDRNSDKWKQYQRSYRQSNASVFRSSAAKRKALKLRATPAWANSEAIAKIYREAERMQQATKKPYHVDHIVPLQGVNVCGLHVENNLQVITAAENIKKSNKF